MRIEHWWYTAPLRLRSLFRRRGVEQELDEELQFHLEHKIEQGIAAGLSPAEARRRALLAMGGIEQRKEEVRDTRRVNWLTDFVGDVQFALRSLRRTPGLAAFVVLTLALGIGMTTTPYSMLDGLVFRPYPVPNPGNVVSLLSTTHDDPYGSFSYREYLDLRDADPSFDPARPVLAAYVREREDGVEVPVISDAFASRATDLLNAVYEVILQLLARYFAHTDESEDQLRVLAQVAM